MDDLIKKLEELEAGFNLPICPSWMYTAVRHCQRNVDIDVEDGFNEPDRYDGTYIAELVNMLPSIIAALHQPQTDALKIAREALTKARNTLAGCGMPKIAADICDKALEALKETT